MHRRRVPLTTKVEMASDASGSWGRSSIETLDGDASASGNFDSKEAKLSRDKSSAKTLAIVLRYNGENGNSVWLPQMSTRGACG